MPVEFWTSLIGTPAVGKTADFYYLNPFFFILGTFYFLCPQNCEFQIFMNFSESDSKRTLLNFANLKSFLIGLEFKYSKFREIFFGDFLKLFLPNFA